MFYRLLSFLHISFYRQKVNHLAAVLYIRRVLSIDQEFLCRGGFCQHSTGIDKTFTIFRVIAIKAPRFWDTGAFFMSHRSNHAALAHTAADPAEFSNIRGHSSDKVRVPFLSLPLFSSILLSDFIPPSRGKLRRRWETRNFVASSKIRTCSYLVDV